MKRLEPAGRRRPRLGYWILAALALGACRPAPPAAPGPGVILVTIDTLRADRLSSAGYPLPTTPGLDRLATRGTRFLHAFSASSSTVPSHAAILTGRYPSFLASGCYNGQFHLGERATTIAEIVAQKGQRTWAVVSNPVLRHGLGLAQGFAVYDDDMEREDLHRKAKERDPRVAVDRALAALDELAGAGFFLWLHIQDPHGPYLPPKDAPAPPIEAYPALEGELPPGSDHSGHRAIPRYQLVAGEFRIADYHRRYDGELAYADRQLERLWKRLESDPKLAQTLVIVTGDHGEAFGEDGYYFAHSHSVGRDQVSVPLIVVGPGLPAGATCRTPVSNLSAFETILDFLDLPSRRTGQAASLLPLITGSAAAPPEPVWFESLSQVGMVWDNVFLRMDRQPTSAGDFWTAPNPNSGGFWKPLGSERFAPLDAALPTPIHSEADLRARLDAWRVAADAAQSALVGSRQKRELTPEDEANLRALGYLQ